MRQINRILLCVSVSVALCSMLTSCRLVPEKRDSVADRAGRKGFESRQLEAGQFNLFVLYRGLETDAPLTVYVEGDGRGWRRKSGPPKDPTPKNPVALELALLDQSSAVLYVARPCQWLDSEELAACSANYWANYRYAEEVIDSVNKAISWAISRSADSEPGRRVGMVGFSGGGTVAALVSARRDDVDWLVSLSANLDHDAWTREAGLTALSQSLNPTDFADELAQIAQLHLIGNEDEIVPFSVLKSYSSALGGEQVKLEVHEGFDHSCCWEDIWPARLDSFVETVP
jgi:hypothetical protein